MKECEKCGEETAKVLMVRGMCMSCAFAPAEKQAEPEEVTPTGKPYHNGARFNPRMVQRGVNAEGKKFVRTRPVGVMAASPKFTPGFESGFTAQEAVEYPWGPWV